MMTTQIVNREEALERLGGDTELLREIVGMFLEDCPALLVEIGRAVEACDAPEIQRTAHGMKGALGNFAANRAVAAAYDLEQIGGEGRVEHAPAAFVTLKREIECLIPVLAMTHGDDR